MTNITKLPQKEKINMERNSLLMFHSMLMNSVMLPSLLQSSIIVWEDLELMTQLKFLIKMEKLFQDYTVLEKPWEE
jgi:hypothetical protein